jgi:hypothetical protein
MHELDWDVSDQWSRKSRLRYSTLTGFESLSAAVFVAVAQALGTISVI